MKRGILLASVFLCVITLSAAAMAQVMSQTKTNKPKDIILTTEDIRDNYKVIGIISIRSGEVSLESLNAKLKDAARQLGADYVIGVNYLNYSGYVYAYGTAVKIKEKE